MDKLDNEYFMMLALKQAQQAYDQGEFPVGCVIVHGGDVIASGARLGTTSDRAICSELDHAEIRALRMLETRQVAFDPKQAVVFSTMEPCLMCLGAILIAGIRKVVYAYEDPMGGATSCDLSRLTPLYAEGEIDIIPGVLRQKSLDLFYNFFNKETNQYWKKSLLEEYTLEQK